MYQLIAGPRRSSRGSNATSKSTTTMWLRPPCGRRVGAAKPRRSFTTLISVSPCRRMANREVDEERTVTSLDGGGPIAHLPSARANVAQRVNVALAVEGPGADDELWRVVPGDIVTTWRPDHFDIRTSQAGKRQSEERSFYIPCSRCGRLISQIEAEGPVRGMQGPPLWARDGVAFRRKLGVNWTAGRETDGSA